MDFVFHISRSPGPFAALQGHPLPWGEGRRASALSLGRGRALRERSESKGKGDLYGMILREPRGCAENHYDRCKEVK